MCCEQSWEPRAGGRTRAMAHGMPCLGPACVEATSMTTVCRRIRPITYSGGGLYVISNVIDLTTCPETTRYAGVMWALWHEPACAGAKF